MSGRAERLQQMRFIAAGAWNTLFGYGAFLAAHAVMGASYDGLAALLIGYAIALPQAYVIQKWFVFRSSTAWGEQFKRFASVNTIVFAINAFVMPLAVRLTAADPRLVQGIFVAAVTLASYFSHKHFTFRQE